MSAFEPGLEAARQWLPVGVRRAIYAVVCLVGYTLSAVVVALTTADLAVPTWLTVTLSVLGALSAPLATVAVVNVAAPSTPTPQLAEPVFLPIGDDPVEADA